jgi:glucose/arabinose dehydrogenase/PKD repeat protein
VSARTGVGRRLFTAGAALILTLSLLYVGSPAAHAHEQPPWEEFQKVPLDTNTEGPFALEVAPDGHVLYTEISTGRIRVYDPDTQITSTAITLSVYTGGEDGLLGIALAPDFAGNRHVFVYYSPAGGPNVNRLSRFTVDANWTISSLSEVEIIEVPAGRVDEPGHTGGYVRFGPDGNLFLSVGDEVNPHTEPSGGYAPLSTVAGTDHDARATSANTNDLRGKLLRIRPNPNGGYSIPPGNMFAPGTPDTRPEIYAMGFRNPFRFSVDPVTGWVGLADYGPDAGTSNPDRGPAGIVEWNLIKEPGFFGWPLCVGPSTPYRDVDYTTNPPTVGPEFDCDNPVNDSPKNTGLTNLPPAKKPLMWYGYETSSVPSVIPAGGGVAPMGGPFYDFDPDLSSDTKFPPVYDGLPFHYEWSKNEVYSIELSGGGDFVEVDDFLPDEDWRSPMDMKFGPEGSLYVLEWGEGFSRNNPDSGLYRVDYLGDQEPAPIAVAGAAPDSGPAPLPVEFSSEGSADPAGGALSYAWDFNDDGTIDSTAPNPTHTYSSNGVFNARLTVTSSQGRSGSTVAPVTVGNTRPAVTLTAPPDGGFFDWGEELSYQVSVSDPEDGGINESAITVTAAVGHDDHAHPTSPISGANGSVVTNRGGHGGAEEIFWVLEASYTDNGGAGGTPALTGTANFVLHPKHMQAEHYSDQSGVGIASQSGAEGGTRIGDIHNNDWIAFDRVNLTNISGVSLRYSSAGAGGTVEWRAGSPTGTLLASQTLNGTGGWDTYVWTPDASLADPGGTFTLYLVFKNSSSTGALFDIDALEFQGAGVGNQPGARHVLIFTETAAFRHGDTIATGTPIIQAALEEVGITSEHTEDSSIFNDDDLARFDALVMFQASGDPWTSAEKAALEAYQQAGGGIVAIHNAADMRGGYAWWDNLIGSLMPGHADGATSPGQTATVDVEDQVHPSTVHLSDPWLRADEWYNFSTNPRETAHVLLTVDESSYDPGSFAMGDDHPISWCKLYEGGRAWITAMGHYAAHYTDEPDFVAHLVGGVQWAANQLPGDCSVGGTTPPPGGDIAGDTYTLTAQHSNKLIDVEGGSTADGSDVVQWPATGGDNQKWQAVAAGTGIVELRALHSDKCLSVEGDSTAAGANLEQSTCTGSDSQKWEPILVSGSAYRFQNVDSGLCADVDGESTADGATIIQWDCKTAGGANQQWQLTQVT